MLRAAPKVPYLDSLMPARTIFPNLSWGFRKNRRLLRQVEVAESLGYIKYLDGLVTTLKRKGCRNIPSKIEEAGDLSHLQSIISELKIAEILTSRGKKTTLLTGSRIPTSDILAHSYRDAYIEVKRLSEDAVRQRLVKNLVGFCNRAGLQARIDIRLGSSMSVPAITRAQRTRKEERADTCFRSFSRR